ncbi:cyclic-di-AMP receptor [Patescibacteria group bacterium]
MEKLIIAIINSPNINTVKQALLEKDVRLTEVQSFGGFTGKKSATFYIGAEAKQVDDIIDTIKKKAKRKSEFIAGGGTDAGSPMPDAPLAKGTAKLASGGALVFVLDAEKSEKI